MLNALGVGGGKHFTNTKICFLFWDENLGATFTTRPWILMAQMPRTDLYIDQVVEFSSSSFFFFEFSSVPGFPLKSKVFRCLTISRLLSFTPKFKTQECDPDNSLVDTK